MKRRIISIITALALCLSLCPAWAFAVEGEPDTGLCDHHPEHTGCGYVAPTEGHDCGHQHTAECYTLGVLPDANGGNYYEIGADAENLLDCQHSHDSECGYVQADPGQPCGYECRICPIEALIAALPDGVTEDNTDDVRAQLDAILSLYRELNEDEQGQIGLSRVYALQGALDEANDPDPVEGAVAYQEASWNGGVTYTTQTAATCTPVVDSAEAVTWSESWYAVSGTVTIDQPITVNGDVSLILADGCTLNASQGIVVTTNNNLTIYAQSGGSGTLNATGTVDSSKNASAGIGGGTSVFDSGSITIHGGVINATGGGMAGYYGAAGIGGGRPNSGNGGSSGAITIYGGTITANSGAGDMTGAGIGGGASSNDGNGGAGSNITIYGGSVTAASTGTGTGGAGIGGGGGMTGGGASSDIQILGGTVNATGSNRGAGIGGGGSGDGTSGAGSNITISGGEVTAVGGNYAAGIGGGGGYQNTYGGCTGGTGSVTINGGIVDASSPTDVYYANYKGAPIGNGGNAGDTAATVSRDNAIVFENGVGTVCGDVTLDGSYTLPVGYTLNIPVGASLSGSGTLSGGGTFTTENLTEDMISVPTDLYYTGDDRTADITIRLSGELTKGVTICGQTFTVSGWTLAVAKAADSDLTYTATYTNDSDNTKTVQKTITLQKSGTDLSEGKVKTYKGETETKDFTADDTITVKATPTPTGAAPDNSAMFAASFTGPGRGQMAVFVNDTQVSAPADVGEDGSYTMTVSAADVLLVAGGPGTEITLTAKFVGNTSMADGAGTATVNITAVAEAEKDGTVIGYFGVSNFEGTNNLFFQNAYTNATITLLGDVQPGTNSVANTTCSTMVNITCTLDLAGHQFTSTDTAIYVLPQGNLTVRDNSTGKTGTVSSIKSDGTLKLYGGTFGKIETAYTLASLLAENCAYYRDSTPIPLSELAEQKELTGTVTVQECQHTGVPVKDLGNGKHGLDCPYCGYHSEHTTALTATASGNNVTLNGGCSTEGCGYQTPLGTASFTFPKVTYGQSGDVTCAWDGPTGYYVLIEVVSGNPLQFDKDADENIAEIALGLAQLFGSTKITAGRHKLKVSFYSDDVVRSNACELDFTIDPAPLTADMVTLGQTDVTYNGTEQKPAVTVAGELAEGTDYEVSYKRGDAATTDFTNAGTANITVTGKGNYEGEVEKTFTIGKATPTIAWANNEVTLTYTGQPANIKPTVTLVDGETFSGTITYKYGVYSGPDRPTDAGSYTVKASIPEQGNYTAAESGWLILYINPADQTAPAAPTATDANIKDTGITLDTIENAEYSKDGTNWQTSPEFTDLSPNTEYTFYARLKADDNHNASPSSTGVTITTKKTMLDGATVTVSGSYTYTGTAIVPAAGEVTVELNGTTINSSQYTISASNNTNAGTATVTITATENGDYSGSASTTFTIGKAALTIKASDQTITYGGSIATGADQVTATGLASGDTLESVTLTPSTSNVPGGTIKPTGAVIKRSGEDVTANYTIAYQEGTLTINKAQAAVTDDPAANTLTYTGEAQALVTAGTASVGEVVYSLTETGTYSTTIPTGTDAGSYTVWYKIADTGNYTGTAPVKVDVTISKVDYTGEKAGSTSGKFGREKTYDLSDLLPEGYKLGMPTKMDTNNIFDGDPTVNGTVLTYKLADNAEVGKTGKIAVTVTESTNYNPFDLTITVTVTDKIVPTLAVNPITVAYTGSAVSASAIQGTATAEGKTIPGSWKFADGQALTNVADSGTKTVIFTPTGEAEADYASATGTVRVTITKATPSLTLTPSPATLPNGGTVTLTLSGLPAGGSATVTCSEASITVTKGSGDTWTAELPAGGASYTFTASYAGDGNHNGATANCTVSVEKITPTLKLTPSSESLTGGGAVTLTLTGLPTGGTATVTCSGGITVTAGAGSTWTATLPNSTATYTFTASYAGNDSYHEANATCSVETREVIILPDQPTGDNGEQLRLVMETGISEVPDGLKGIETLDTPEKLETAMKTEITQATPGIPEASTAVYDVALMVSTDGGATWTKADKDNFPSGGLTVTLPYPSGTNSSYRFTVVHMFTTSDFPGKNPGDTEVFTPDKVKNTPQGLQVVVTGLSPISVGWEQPSTPATPSGPSSSGGGGGWITSTYAVTVEKSEHGKVTSNRTNASSNSTVTLTVTPDSGYVLDALTVTDSRGNEIKLTAQGGGKYTFTMPSRAVTVKATFAPLPDDTVKPCDGGADCPSRGFTDLGTVGTWYHEAVDYVLRHGLMNGYSNGTFGPNDNLSRAQFAQILFNKEGRPVVNYLLQYSDVADGAWYTEAIRWATSQGIVGGYGNGTFGPNDNITREQLAVMLWRYAGSPAATDKELHFNDADKASGYALAALRWAVENGVINGKGGGILDPQGLATRAQTAQMLKNFLGK